MTAISEHNGEKIYYNEKAKEWRYVTTNKPVKLGLWDRLKNKILRRRID